MKKRINIKNNQSGFTIIELLIATLVFSIILLITTEAVIQISRTYIRGYIGSETQNANRGILDQISQAIQLSGGGGVVIPPSQPYLGYYWFCVNDVKYTYRYNTELTPTSGNVFISDAATGTDCSTPDTNPPAGTATELLSQHMRIVKPSNGAGILGSVNGIPSLYSLSMNVLYGDSGTFNTLSNTCEPISSGGAFCSTSAISTTVQQRTTTL